MSKTRNGFWKNKLGILEEIMPSVDSYSRAAFILKDKFGIHTSSDTLATVCRMYKIERPLITANWGGARR